MRLLAAEFVTGGGLHGLPLPPGLTREADLMIRALVAELSAVTGVQLLTTRDRRLPDIAGIEALHPAPGEAFLPFYRRALRQCDAAWPTAPETDGTLLQLVRGTQDAECFLLGSQPDAVALTASKRATSRALLQVGIPAVETFDATDALPELPGRWVVKPDDGAGAADTILLDDWRSARSLLLDPAGSGRVAQPWINGEALSLSLLCREGAAHLLAVNRQRMIAEAGRLSLVALEVNAIADDTGRFATLGRRVAAAIPGLTGYVGVDLIDTVAGPVVLEINPRLTTSYCGLRQATGINVAAATLALLQSGTMPPIPSRPAGSSVTLELEVPIVR